MIEICAVGGYNEVGKNMTAVKFGDEAVILDMGLHLENYIKYTEDEDILNLSGEELIRAGAIADISVIRDWIKSVKAIIPTHAHLDHIGAIPYISNRFNAPILCTPFAGAVVNAICTDGKIHLKNPVKTLNVNSIYHLSNSMIVEFVNVTHSTPQTVMVAIHTKKGIVIYANDFKFDLYPTMGNTPNFERLRELGKKGVYALIVDSTYAYDARKMPSESVAKQMLKDVMLGTNSKGKGIIITTFSSHLARLKSIVEFGKKLDRKVIFFGRSLAKYTKAGEDCGLVDFSKDVEIVAYGSKIKKKMKKIERKREKYVFVVTGHQGEPKATLSKMVDGKINFHFNPEDHVIFSCKIIPSPTNVKNRERLEKMLKSYGVRIFKDIHVSGHAAREDLRDLINLVKPKHIIPAHGEPSMLAALKELALEMGYKPDHIHLMRNGDKIKI